MQNLLNPKYCLSYVLICSILLTHHVNSVKISNKKFKGMYNLGFEKIPNNGLIFTEGTWYSFSNASDGRILEFHPSETCFLLNKTSVGGAITSILFLEPQRVVLAFYKDKKPVPAKTLFRSSGAKRGKTTAEGNVSGLVANEDTTLKLLNQVPFYETHEIMKKLPHHIYRFWDTLYDTMNENEELDYLTAPFAPDVVLPDEALRKIYLKVSRYFAVITLYPGIYEPSDSQFWSYNNDEVMVPHDKEYEEDRDRPGQFLTQMQNPDHLCKEFRAIIEYYTVLTKAFIIEKLFFSEYGLKQALLKSGDSLEELLDRLKNPNSSIGKFINFKYIYQAHKIGMKDAGSSIVFEPSETNQDLTVIIENFMREVYSHGEGSYKDFVRYRGKVNNGKHYQPKSIGNKVSKDIMEHIFRYFTEVAMGYLLSAIVEKFKEVLNDSNVLQGAQLGDISDVSGKNLTVLKKYMKLLGYISLQEGDSGLITYSSFDIFKNDRLII